MIFPVLYAKNKNGSYKIWKISVLDHLPSYPIIKIEYGLEHGKLIESEKSIDEMKRGYVSKLDYAKSVAESKWKHKKEREGYSEIRDSTSDIFSLAPMLAKTFENGKHLHFPLYIQPKIDGLRCIACFKNSTVQLFSRTQMEFRSSCLDPLRNSLKDFFSQHPSVILDGELYANDVPFEELSGAIRKDDASSLPVYYIIFDVMDTEKSFQQRFVEDLKFSNSLSKFLKKCPTYLTNSLEEARLKHEEFISQGYEGTIFRNSNSLYKKGYRSWDLQKWKDVREEEFEIVGFTEGESGREKGTVIWECKTKEGKIFRVRPRGSLDYRKKLFIEASGYIGSKLTVLFQEYTKEKIPRFPVGKEIRKNY